MDGADEVIARLQRSAEVAQRVLDATFGGIEESTRAGDGAMRRESGPQWIVRYTWQIINGLHHPEHTFANHWTESKAVDSASCMLLNFYNGGSLKLMAAHVRGPSQPDWIRVE